MVERRYSKSFDGYAEEKRGYFDANEEQLRLVRSQNRLYVGQPRRKACKLCGALLRDVLPDLVQHVVAYVFCDSCGHLNGAYEDTEAFTRALYTANGGEEYAADYYMNTDFRKRAEAIYVPKVEFLTESLPDVKLLSVLDVGCGAGHLVYAALRSGIPAYGIDVSAAAVDFGNRQIVKLGKETPPLLVVRGDDFYKRVMYAGVSVISAVGLIEHLRKPAEFFDAFDRSEAEYLFFSVPMVSLSVYLENALPFVWPRQLSGAHTHLFTEESLAYLYEQEGLEPVAEWRFGTDAMDLYRSLWVSLRQNYATEKAVRRLEEAFSGLLEPLQEALDRAHFCSEIHVVAKRA